MKQIQPLLLLEPRTIVLLLGLAVGVGLAVNEIFFIVGLVVVLLIAGHWTMQKGHEYLRDVRLCMRHT